MTVKRSVLIILIGVLIFGGIHGIWVLSTSDSHTRDNEYDALSEFRVDFPKVAHRTGNPFFELKTSLPDVADEIMIYKVKQPDITVDAVTELGRRLGFDGDVIVSDGWAPNLDGGTIFKMIKDKVMLEVWSNSGAVVYNNNREINFPNEAPDLPSGEDTKVIAARFLVEAGLLPPDAVIRDPGPGATYSGTATNSAGEVVPVSYVGHLQVSFNRYIDGITVTGARLSVRIGDNGQIGRVLKVWPEIEPYEKMKIKSPQTALRELKAGKGEHDAASDCKKVVINRVYLAYWMEGSVGERQDYVVPVYVFEGESFGPNGKKLEDFGGWCNAL